MSWLGSLFGTKKAVDHILDKDNGLASQVGGWIGGMNYTEQEKAEMNLKMGDVINSRLKALEPFKIVQRIIVGCVMFIWLLTGLSWLFAMFTAQPTLVTDLKAFATSDFIAYPTTGVFLLYLFGGVIDSTKRSN